MRKTLAVSSRQISELLLVPNFTTACGLGDETRSKCMGIGKLYRKMCNIVKIIYLLKLCALIDFYSVFFSVEYFFYKNSTW